MATAFALLTQTALSQEQDVTIRFETLSGELTVATLPQDSGSTLYLKMDFPLGHPEQVTLDSSSLMDLVHALGLECSFEEESLRFAYCRRTKKFLVEFPSATDILALSIAREKLLSVG